MTRIVRTKKNSPKKTKILLILIAICTVMIIGLFIIDAQSISDGSLPGMTAVFIFIPLTLVFTSILVGPIRIVRDKTSNNMV